ncbi:MAG: hypothetical protein Tsb002_25890 [Wenzhouxiangellaceae bacterium]
MMNRLTRLLGSMVVVLLLSACEGPGEEAQPDSGAMLYQQHCAACHGDDGAGRGNVFPPLAGSEWLRLPPEKLAEVVLRGVAGPVIVAGRRYNGQMPAQRHLDDATLARLLNQITRQWGGAAVARFDAALVAQVRQSVGDAGPLRGPELDALLSALTPG